MTLDRYSDLIRNLPYLDQAFESKEATWQKHINHCDKFSSYCRKTFITESIKFSRRDVFNSCQEDFIEGLFTTIIWGYPRNMRGNNFTRVLSSLNKQKIESCFPNQRNLSEKQFFSIANKLNNTGVGLSTLSKLLYFFHYTVENHQCLILDSRIIEVLNDVNVFTELRLEEEAERINEFNKLKKYVSYLRIMKEVSNVNNYKPDQLELFLFLMGRNLKAD